MSAGERFRAAVEAGDIDGMTACLADDVVFHSPVTFRAFEGKPAVSLVLATVMTVFENFRYINEMSGGGAEALHFVAQANGRDVEGLDVVRENADGLIDDFTVLVRPLSGLQALAEAMAAKLPPRP